MQEFFIALFIIIATVALYLVMAKIYVRFSYPILIPVLTTTVFVILLLLAFHISYDEYMIGGKWINSLLGPAVVALAYPLYKQREMLVKYS
ncbi:LrgB family protein, partial [Priestia megaterium]